jgi:hypothetical protein
MHQVMHALCVGALSYPSTQASIQDAVKQTMAKFFSGDPTAMKAAEGELLAMATVPGFGASLCELIVDSTVPEALRQVLIAVLL